MILKTTLTSLCMLQKMMKVKMKPFLLVGEEDVLKIFGMMRSRVYRVKMVEAQKLKQNHPFHLWKQQSSA